MVLFTCSEKESICPKCEYYVDQKCKFNLDEKKPVNHGVDVCRFYFNEEEWNNMEV